jgi:copper homeostasis protein CutC
VELTVHVEVDKLVNAIYALAQAIALEAGQALTEVKSTVTSETGQALTEVKTKASSEVSIETVRAKLAELTQAGRQAAVRDILKEFGASKLSEVPADKYSDLIKAVDAV